jgi:hypothetical protein
MGELKHLLGKGASWDQSNGESAHRVVISGNETLGTKGINNLFDKDTGTKLWFTEKSIPSRASPTIRNLSLLI